MRLKLLLIFAILFTLQTNAQTLNPTFNISNEGTANVFKGGYTFSYATAGTPWNGALLSFGGFSNQYDCQISADYGPNGGSHISYRTRNGDISQWNSWNELATRGVNTFNGNQNVNGELKISSYSPLLVLQRDTNVGGFIQGIQTKNLDNTNNWFFGNLHANSWIVSKGDFNNAKFTILDNGNIGIGTSDPQSKFIVMDGNQGFSILTNKKLIGTWPPTSDATTMTIQSSGNSAGNLAFATGNSEAMRIIPNGFIGIGTTAPDEKLTVKGKIHAQEVKVDLHGACAPDYVFQKYYTGKSDLKSDYIMPTLAEIESFTKKNHHLSNVPSAREVQQNGLSLGEMSNVLLQKVEELTLYIIEQNKDIEGLKAQVTALMAKSNN